MSKSLIINCASPYFFYIPMGTFGLCDYLGRQGIETCIFSPSLYPQAELRKRLLKVLAQMQPSHVGFVCHWQETTHGLLEALEVVREWSPEVVRICGGFTASYFGEELLATLPALDYVVVGDPEEPVLELLSGTPPPKVANLIRREDGRVVRNGQFWLMDAATLDEITFTDLRPLIDAEIYLQKISAKLGFPLMLGRGCVFDCAYCGGSRHAFRLHSGRQKPVVRAIRAVLRDLHLLKPRTRILYLCYENDQASIKQLFQAIADDPELRGHFTLHYGAWHLLDQCFLELYRAAFDCTTVAPIFEFSPEVVDDEKRAAIKRGITYNLAGLEQNCAEIAAFFAGKVRIEIFFSRYHPLLTEEDLNRELAAILDFKLWMLVAGLPVHSCFDHLSTDVASRYWHEERLEPKNFARFLSEKQQVDENRRYPFPVDNLCLLIPDHLPADFVQDFETLVFTLEQLERFGHELVFILTTWYGPVWLVCLREVGILLRRRDQERYYLFPPLDEVVALLGQQLPRLDSSPPPFLQDLIRFTRIKQKQGQGAKPSAPVPVGADAALFYRLDQDRVLLHEQDYLDLIPLLKRIQERTSDQLAYQRTVSLFCSGGILSLAHSSYRILLRPFEQPRLLKGHLATLDSQQQRFFNQLIEEAILRPMAAS
ncbi:MAG: radical SAM protein [Desulfobulbus sp.]